MWDLYPLSPSSYAKELPAPFWHWGVCVSVWGGGELRRELHRRC
jgi:hypothetical protein